MNEHMALFKAADQVIETLQASGHDAYRVGGCVRDQWLARPISDIDIATSATPDEVIQIFERTVPTGIQHGTVLVFQGEFAFEVTTFRTESAYQDFRRPTEVQFVQRIEDDLARRDFTMNAMAQRLDGTIIDPFHGQVDLNQRLVRCVGDAQVRFEEDALRMLRAVRFAAQLGFTIETKTLEALHQNCGLLRHIAMERVGQEVVKIMDSAEPLYGLRLLLDTQLLQHTKNQLHIDEPYFERQLDKVAQIEQLPVGALRWAQLFIAVSYGERDAKKLLTALKLPNRLQHEVEHLLMIHKMLQQAGESKAQWIFAVLATSRESAEAYLKLVPKNKVDEYSKWLKTMGATSVAELHISGNQVIELGVRRGPEVGRLLQELLEKVALGELVNEPNALIRMAKQLGERR